MSNYGQVLSIIEWPHPTLRRTAQAVTQFDPLLHHLVDQMWDTMYAAPGVGLAAPQVNQSLRIFVMDCAARESEARRFVAINPILIDPKGNVQSSEGCLSFPGLNVTVSRAEEVTLIAQDLNGVEYQERLTGLEAICAQHELDHLDGLSFIDHLPPLERVSSLQKYLDELQKLPDIDASLVSLTKEALETSLNEALKM